MRVATFNVQNLRLRRLDGQDQLHGAWDSDAPEDKKMDPSDRRLTAELLTELKADVVALQEVFDLETLDYFHENFLLPAGAQPYPHRICVPGNDGRGLDVALISRPPISAMQSHASLTLTELDIDPPKGADPDLPLFRRDCLMVSIGPLTLFVCHFKSPYPDVSTAWTTRRLEALATRRLIERNFKNPTEGLWLILGDLNEPSVCGVGRQRAIEPLESGFAIDLMLRLPKKERWTYYDPHSGLYHCPDAILASPALAKLCSKAEPVVVRKGLGAEVSRFRGSRLAGIGRHRPHASDHAAVVVDFPEL
ncbi:MAG: endonuclease/exonuclease/phosphatase family protein [Hyphomicrobiales bacterium]|nr:endonuclease/exonuclease/phosphatase family protein [Hyphomicrobiales bacterium]